MSSNSQLLKSINTKSGIIIIVSFAILFGMSYIIWKNQNNDEEKNHQPIVSKTPMVMHQQQPVLNYSVIDPTALETPFTEVTDGFGRLEEERDSFFHTPEMYYLRNQEMNSHSGYGIDEVSSYNDYTQTFRQEDIGDQGIGEFGF